MWLNSGSCKIELYVTLIVCACVWLAMPSQSRQHLKSVLVKEKEITKKVKMKYIFWEEEYYNLVL